MDARSRGAHRSEKRSSVSAPVTSLTYRSKARWKRVALPSSHGTSVHAGAESSASATIPTQLAASGRATSRPSTSAKAPHSPSPSRSRHDSPPSTDSSVVVGAASSPDPAATASHEQIRARPGSDAPQDVGRVASTMRCTHTSPGLFSFGRKVHPTGSPTYVPLGSHSRPMASATARQLSMSPSDPRADVPVASHDRGGDDPSSTATAAHTSSQDWPRSPR
mmetsp:Transcript_26051/g.77130  ORF Transcript_26051/g.77130 Transcript_26051/m.77130 type:complete len:221 (-) Transcript_26051:544-1206(-)